MKNRTRTAALFLALFMALACTGCAAAGVDRLYALPQLSDEYVQLEELIAQRIRNGSEYAAPTAGRNRQSVQMHDLDGDAVPEAIAFLADSSHVPTVCVYRQGGDGDYALYAILSGEGSAVGSVEYADLTGDGVTECVIVWQLSGDMRILSVYSLRAEEPSRLMNANCSDFLVGDLDGNGTQELLLLRSEDGANTLVRYEFSGDGEPRSSEARLSSGITDVLRMRTGYLSDGSTALFVESEWEGDELITDVFTASADALTNITMASGGRSNTLRQAGAFAADINADRIMEIPESSGDVLSWYSVDPSGRRSLVMTTYHDYGHSWYLALDEKLLAGTLIVREEEPAPGETATSFVTDAGGEGRQTVLVIYTLTGENRLDRAGEEGRFILKQTGDTVYAAALLTDAITREEVAAGFNIIYTEWQTWE